MIVREQVLNTIGTRAVDARPGCIWVSELTVRSVLRGYRGIIAISSGPEGVTGLWLATTSSNWLNHPVGEIKYAATAGRCYEVHDII